MLLTYPLRGILASRVLTSPMAIDSKPDDHGRRIYIPVWRAKSPAKRSAGGLKEEGVINIKAF